MQNFIPRCLTTNKRTLRTEQRASLPGARKLLGAPGLTMNGAMFATSTSSSSHRRPFLLLVLAEACRWNLSSWIILSTFLIFSYLFHPSASRVSLKLLAPIFAALHTIPYLVAFVFCQIPKHHKQFNSNLQSGSAFPQTSRDELLLHIFRIATIQKSTMMKPAWNRPWLNLLFRFVYRLFPFLCL